MGQTLRRLDMLLDGISEENMDMGVVLANAFLYETLTECLSTLRAVSEDQQRFRRLGATRCERSERVRNDRKESISQRAPARLPLIEKSGERGHDVEQNSEKEED